MRGLGRLTWTSLKLILREPIGWFVTLALPSLLLAFFGALAGRKPLPQYGGLTAMAVLEPGFAAMVLAIVAFFGLPVSLGGNRELGVLRRFRATPLRPLAYIIADVVSNLSVAFGGVIILVLVASLLFRAPFRGNVLSVGTAVILGGLEMSAVGYLIGTALPSQRAAGIVGLVLFYPTIYLSGAFFPLTALPETLRNVVQFLPLSPVVELFGELWRGGSWAAYLPQVAVIVGYLILCTALASRWFRWE